MDTGGDSPTWQGQDMAATTAGAQAEAVKTTTADAKAAAIGGGSAPTSVTAGASGKSAIAARGSKVQCVDPTAVKGYKLRCAQLPKAIRELLEDLMGADDLVVTYNTQLEPKRCLYCTPFARRDVLDMTFGHAGVEFLKGVAAETSKLRAWRYREAGDDAGRIKFGAVDPLLNLTDLPREYGLGSLSEDESVRFPTYPLSKAEQEIARNDANERLTAITALPAFVEAFTFLTQANPRLRQQMEVQLQTIIDQVLAWRCGVDDRKNDGGWRQLFPVLECTQLPAAAPARPGERLKKADLEQAAGEPVREGPPSRQLPEAFLSFALGVDDATQRALQRQKKAGTCDLLPLRVEFKHAQPTDVRQSAAQVIEDALQLQVAITTARATAVLFKQMKFPLTIIIRGYTDRSGAPKFDNVALSVLRAQWLEFQIRSALGGAVAQIEILTDGCGDQFADRSQPKHRPSRVAVVSFQ